MLLLGLEIVAGSFAAYHCKKFFSGQNKPRRSLRIQPTVHHAKLPMVIATKAEPQRPNLLKRMTNQLLKRRSLAPVILLVAGLVFVTSSGYLKYFSFDNLRLFRHKLGYFWQNQPMGLALAFIAIYALTAAMSLPVAAFMTITGGWIFGTWLGAALATSGATLGAYLLFLAVRAAMRDDYMRRHDQRLEAMRSSKLGHRGSLMMMRLLPIFPFAFVNIVGALLGFSTTTFLVETILGVIPLAVIYASLGAGLGQLLEGMAAPSLAALLQPQILLPMLALSLIATLPSLLNNHRLRAPQPA